MSHTSLFSGESHAQIYKAYRPAYSDEIFLALADTIKPWVPENQVTVAVDVGCGSGQATKYLETKFDFIIGIDPSFPQLKEAYDSGICHKNGDYIVGTDEHLAVRDLSCDYIQVFEAAHWFDLKKFYAEVDRVLKPGGVLVLGVYGFGGLDPEDNKELVAAFGLGVLQKFNESFKEFYSFLIDTGCFRRDVMENVDSLYRDISLPFSEQKRLYGLKMRERWNVERFLAYLRTWSGWQIHKNRTGDESLLDELGRKLEQSFGDRLFCFSWPVGLLFSRKPLKQMVELQY